MGKSKRRRRRSTSPDESKTLDESGRHGEKRRLREFRDFDFERHRSKLSRIFFREEDLVQRGTDEYRDFWKFLSKYQSFQREKASSRDSRGKSSTSGPVYNRRLTQSFKLLPQDPLDLLARIPFQDPDDLDPDEILTEEVVAEFQTVLGMYVDFLQREKFAKLRKLRETQANLPIAEFRTEILEKLEKNQVIIIAGDTGCGKSTQVPQYLLRANYSRIACTQPRRIACVALAKRVGHETLNEYGTEVGYQIRFEKKRTGKTRVLFLTEGLLLRQVASDPGLAGYDVLVLDEVHERHLHADFLLGIVKCLVQQRPDVKVVLMSATINIQLFRDYFDGEAPVVQVPGRLFPIKVRYMPVPSVERSSASERLNPAPYVRVLQLIDQKYPKGERGDLLIFLSGIKEITAVVDACKEYSEKTSNWIVLPLHSTLSLADQDKVFDYAPEGVRKCIVSTNIAETSITIDGIRFVVDSGKVKEMQFDPVCKMQRLKEFWISRASAEQRKGRSGRTGPGVCFRLFSEADYKSLAAFSTPEIRRVPLDSIVLQMVSMGLPDVRKFPFIEPPAAESIEESVAVLKAQNALADDESLTVVGKVLAKLPVDVSIGKMLIMGTLFHQVEAVLSLAAALSVQSPFTNNAYRDADCVAARRNLDSDHGDPVTLLNSFREWLEVKAARGENSRRWCKKRGLEEQRFYEMAKLRRQFRDLLEDAGLLEKENPADMTSAERTRRNGELKTLRDMKRDFHKREAPRKKKFLKVRMFDADADDDADDAGPDIKDIEFRMRNDASKVRTSSRACSYKDLNILKLILASGLYPQVAIGDEFNHAKSGSEQLYHTRVKPFNLLHPNGIYATNPEYLTIDPVDIVTRNLDKTFAAKYPVSAKHQILVYLALLETNKPYLINTMRSPALQTMLLFARHVDTNIDFSRLVCDSWIEFRFPDVHEAQRALYRAAKLRALWQKLLTLKLADGVEGQGQPDEVESFEQKLSDGLMDFIHSESAFSLRRLLPGDIKVMYYGEGRGQDVDLGANPFDEGRAFTFDKVKGGFAANDFITYNCLVNTAGELAARAKFECEICDQTVYASHMDRVVHYAKCFEQQQQQQAKREEDGSAKSETSRRVDPNAVEHYCAHCDTKLLLNPVQILRHNRSHAKD